MTNANNTQIIVSAEREMLLLFALTKRCNENLQAEEYTAFEQNVWDYFKMNHSDIIERIKVGKGISDDLSEKILVCIENFKASGRVPATVE